MPPDSLQCLAEATGDVLTSPSFKHPPARKAVSGEQQAAAARVHSDL